MNRFTITLPNGSRIEPTKEVERKISDLLFGEATAVANVVTEKPVRRFRNRPNTKRWTPEEDERLRQMINARRGKDIDTPYMKEMAVFVGRRWKAVSARFYALYKKTHDAGNYV